MTLIPSQTEHLSIPELLGIAGRSFESPPAGWRHPRAINIIPKGLEVYVQILKSGQWEKGEVDEFYPKGFFLEVKCGGRLIKIFRPENIVTKELSLIMKQDKNYV